MAESKRLIEVDLYRFRFDSTELTAQRGFWLPICKYLQRYVPADGATLDLGAGFCHFVNNISSRRKVALDVNEENLRLYADPDVEIVTSSAVRLPGIEASSLDTIFASNVYEHFASREDVAESLREVFKALKRNGRLIILQPNFAYCGKNYFDFFDHRLIFTHRGMAEGLVISGFEIERLTPRFLPFTSKSGLPRAPWMVSLYLRLPPVWKVFGAQMLIVARKPASA
jgi:SAM-dependent methyltransferase